MATKAKSPAKKSVASTKPAARKAAVKKTVVAKPKATAAKKPVAKKTTAAKSKATAKTAKASVKAAAPAVKKPVAKRAATTARIGADGVGADLDAEFLELADNTVITPGDVFLGHAQHQLGDAGASPLPADPPRFLTCHLIPKPSAIGFEGSDEERIVNAVPQLGAALQQIGALLGG